MLTLRRRAARRRASRSLRLHGLTRDSWKRYEKKGPGAYDVLEPGYKLNLCDLHAGVALGQLHRIEEHHERRAAQAERYDEGLAGLAGITPLGRRLGPGRRARLAHLRRAASTPSSPARDRDAYAEALGEEGIGSGLHFLPVHDLTYFRASQPDAAAAARRARRRGRCSRCRSRRRTRSTTSTTSSRPCAACTRTSRDEPRPHAARPAHRDPDRAARSC